MIKKLNSRLICSTGFFDTWTNIPKCAMNSWWQHNDDEMHIDSDQDFILDDGSDKYYKVMFGSYATEWHNRRGCLFGLFVWELTILSLWFNSNFLSVFFFLGTVCF